MGRIIKYMPLLNEISGSNSSTSYLIATTALPYVRWDNDAYTGTVKVYMEVMLKTSNASYAAYAMLYTTAGVAVTGSDISTTSTTSTWLRTSDFKANLTDDTNYYLRIKVANASATVTVYAARLVIEQTGAITKTESQISLGGQVVGTTNTSGIDYTYLYYFYWDSKRFDGAVSVYFEATLRNTGVGVTSYAWLADGSNTLVTGSTASVTGTTANRSRSSAITLVDGTTYHARLRTSSGIGTCQVSDVRLIVQQAGFTKTETHYVLSPRQFTDTSTGSGGTNMGDNIVWNYNSNEWIVAVNNVYFEATIATSASTGYLDLNDGSTDLVTITTTSSTKARVRSSAIIPANNTNYDGQTHVGSAATMNITGVRLVIHTQLMNAPNMGANF